MAAPMDKLKDIFSKFPSDQEKDAALKNWKLVCTYIVTPNTTWFSYLSYDWNTIDQSQDSDHSYRGGVSGANVIECHKGLPDFRMRATVRRKLRHRPLVQVKQPNLLKMRF